MRPNGVERMGGVLVQLTLKKEKGLGCAVDRNLYGRGDREKSETHEFPMRREGRRFALEQT